MINNYYSRIQAQGFHSLSYFDIGNWGTRSDFAYEGPAKSCGRRPGGEPAPCPDPDGGNAYLRDKLSAALLRRGWAYRFGTFDRPFLDWVGTTDMDTQVAAFEDLIVEQCARHLAKIPAFEGIAIDRLDYSEFYNYDADDGVSWVPINGSGSLWLPVLPADTEWGPARALRLSYRHTFYRLHQTLHLEQPPGTRKMMLNNCNSLCRIDEMYSFDGTFSEGTALNMVAWTGMRMGTILWTYDLSPDPAVFDPFFQQHLLMDVYPMAPMPLNDHSITPGNPVVEQAYRDYGKLFDSMHGARWLLSSDPAAVEFSVARDHRTSGPVQAKAANSLSMRPCVDSGGGGQRWIRAPKLGDEIQLAGRTETCLGVWCCGCGKASLVGGNYCCDGCASPVDGSIVAANLCHPDNTDPTQQNQRWAVSSGKITELKGGKCLVAAAKTAGSAVEVATCSSTDPANHLAWSNGSIVLPGSNLCATAPPPAPPPMPPSPPAAAVNVFTVAGQDRVLLIPIVLGGTNTTATLTLNLSPTEHELGWPAVSTVTAEAMHPGEAALPVDLGTASKVTGGQWMLKVPLARGMALVRARL